MRIVCAWCRDDMGEKPPLEDTSVTHGMCPFCAAKLNSPPMGAPAPVIEVQPGSILSTGETVVSLPNNTGRCSNQEIVENQKEG